MGYGLLAVGKTTPVLVEMGVVRLNGVSDHAERLQRIFQTMQQLIQKHHPTSLAIEAPFFGKNVQSMLKLGRAQGVAMAAAMMSGLPATEYAPRSVKLAVTGKGNATKDQVRAMLHQVLRFESDMTAPMDATDALAVALCHHYELRKPKFPAVTGLNTPLAAALRSRSNKKSSWAAFAQQNPERVR
jgi:crossover junction endodeoxyribonuclease RuvC